MSTTRTLLLLAATVIAAMALTATSALAEDEGVEISWGSESAHCEQWCDFHAVGVGGLTVHIGDNEVVVSLCTEEFEGEVNETGEGHIDVYTNNPIGEGCTRQRCNGVGEDPTETISPIHFEEETLENTINARFCLDAKANPNATGAHCDMEIHTEDLGDHTWHFTADDEPCPPDPATGINTEASGEWLLDAEGTHGTIEISH
jgi:hypothetical protein